VDSPITSVWRAQNEAATRLAEAWRRMLETSANVTAGQPSDLADQLQALAKNAADYWGAAFGPLRELVDSQRQFADQMMHWAELQRDLADQVAGWARQQRDYTDALSRLLAPFSTEHRSAPSTPSEADPG
jgi:ABC-type transporter Mla subunit MlaD